MNELRELELDALTELVNLGVSRAATSLRDMIQEEVRLSVPNVLLVSRDEATKILTGSKSEKLVAVHQVFEGEITGRALLIFPETKSLELVKAVIGGDIDVEEIIHLEYEALAETGNILLNSCLATIANLLERNLKISLPEILHGVGADFLNLAPPPEVGNVVLFIYINFDVRHRNIDGYIAMLLDMPSLTALKLLLDEFIERSTGRSAAESDI